MHPILWQLGPVTLYSYGAMFALGVLAAWLLIRREALRQGLLVDRVTDLIFIVTLGGIVGARIFYVIQHHEYFAHAPHEIWQIWQGGLVLYGGIIVALATLFCITQWKRISFWQYTDLFFPYVALAQAFGRIGCFLNGCCFGKPFTGPWAVQFPLLPTPVHPTQIYSSLFCLLLFLWLCVLERRKQFHGAVTLAYLTLYPIGRFVIEWFRGDNVPFALGLTLPQLVSLAMFGIAFILRFTYFSLGERQHHEAA